MFFQLHISKTATTAWTEKRHVPKQNQKQQLPYPTTERGKKKKKYSHLIPTPHDKPVVAMPVHEKVTNFTSTVLCFMAQIFFFFHVPQHKFLYICAPQHEFSQFSHMYWPWVHQKLIFVTFKDMKQKIFTQKFCILKIFHLEYVLMIWLDLGKLSVILLVAISDHVYVIYVVIY